MLRRRKCQNRSGSILSDEPFLFVLKVLFLFPAEFLHRIVLLCTRLAVDGALEALPVLKSDEKRQPVERFLLRFFDAVQHRRNLLQGRDFRRLPVHLALNSLAQFVQFPMLLFQTDVHVVFLFSAQRY